MHMFVQNGGFQDYRDALWEELGRRQRRNSSYSLRAFARDLGFAYSTLAEVLAKRKGISLARIEKISHALGWTKDERKVFELQALSLHARSKVQRESARVALSTFYQEAGSTLSLDLFRSVAGWQHYALLELLDTSCAPMDPDQLAQRLGISEKMALESLDRLQRLGLIKRWRGKLQTTQAETHTPNDIPSKALREHHREILSLAEQALELQDFSKREFQSVTFAASTKEVKELKDQIRRFIRDFLSKRSKQRQSANDCVYSLNVQLFRLDRDLGPTNKNQKSLQKGE